MYIIVENPIGEPLEYADGTVRRPGNSWHVVRVIFSGHGWHDTPALQHLVMCASLKSAQEAIGHYEAIDALFTRDLAAAFTLPTILDETVKG